MRMPGRMDGLTPAHEIERRRPAPRILVRSGLGPLDRTARPPKADFFDKPSLTDRVGAAIRTALEGAEAHGA